ncbi:hypothetical protein HRI_002021100 [Hibiscus trionum]|uniref:Uncharacterized protein n=1 Tax=Hibiscus trionum TaxID=183268 RepID=A0A9W7HU45_HIBTR|nr:hypothetical protein HRI_002021100 [Hibiscus trionum]
MIFSLRLEVRLSSELICSRRWSSRQPGSGSLHGSDLLFMPLQPSSSPDLDVSLLLDVFAASRSSPICSGDSRNDM